MRRNEGDNCSEEGEYAGMPYFFDLIDVVTIPCFDCVCTGVNGVWGGLRHGIAAGNYLLDRRCTRHVQSQREVIYLADYNTVVSVLLRRRAFSCGRRITTNPVVQKMPRHKAPTKTSNTEPSSSGHERCSPHTAPN